MIRSEVFACLWFFGLLTGRSLSVRTFGRCLWFLISTLNFTFVSVLQQVLAYLFPLCGLRSKIPRICRCTTSALSVLVLIVRMIQSSYTFTPVRNMRRDPCYYSYIENLPNTFVLHDQRLLSHSFSVPPTQKLLFFLYLFPHLPRRIFQHINHRECSNPTMPAKVTRNLTLLSLSSRISSWIWLSLSTLRQ